MRLALLAAMLTIGGGAVALAQAQTAGLSVPTVPLPGTTVPQTTTAAEIPSVTVSVPSTTVGPVSTPPVTISTPSSGPVTTPVPPSGGVTPGVGLPPVVGGGPSPSPESPASARSAGTSGSAIAAGSPGPAAGARQTARGVVHHSPGARSGPPKVAARGQRAVTRAVAGLAPPAARQGLTSSPPPVRPVTGRAVHRSDKGGSGNPLDTIGGAIPLPIPVPDWSKPIIAALLLLALWLAVRSRVATLRTRRLEGQRASLLRDVGFMQAALVPEVPARLGGLAVSVAYRPAEGPAAGGDFYDVFIPGTGKVAVILGDVAGHGHDALRQAALIRYTLRAYIQAGLEPRMALALAGQTLGQPRGEYFATVAVGIYDRRGSRLTYSLAGHPPPIFLGFEAPEPLTICSSAPVGWTLPTGRRQSTLTLPPRAQVCFFSDGLIEARVEEGLLGRERLTQILDELGQRAQATDLLELVRAAARETRDDMAACILAPVVGVSTAPVHVEELEADVRELASGEVERFIEACRIPSPVIARTLEHASDIASASGTVLLRIELGVAGATVTAVPPVVPALVPPASQPSGTPAADAPTPARRVAAIADEQPALPSLPLRRASDREPSAAGPATAEVL
ncbi:MAG: hypothetical protein JWN81_1524 [Solirubrobacterales bacterium]|nr:hypothetical protein [Solirubrobacterales bacterium]